jgi:hypothetical protein
VWLGVSQRQAVLDAARLAGLNVLGLINSHAAAALQYGIERDFTKKEQTVRALQCGCSVVAVWLQVGCSVVAVCLNAAESLLCFVFPFCVERS